MTQFRAPTGGSSAGWTTRYEDVVAMMWASLRYAKTFLGVVKVLFEVDVVETKSASQSLCEGLGVGAAGFPASFLQRAGFPSLRHLSPSSEALSPHRRPEIILSSNLDEGSLAPARHRARAYETGINRTLYQPCLGAPWRERLYEIVVLNTKAKRAVRRLLSQLHLADLSRRC